MIEIKLILFSILFAALLLLPQFNEKLLEYLSTKLDKYAMIK